MRPSDFAVESVLCVGRLDKKAFLKGRMLVLCFGCFAHNGYCVKSGIQLWFDSQQSRVSPRPSEPGTESVG